jgi:hypothetical protein
MWRSGGTMLTGNAELFGGKSVSTTLRPTQVQFVFLGLEAQGAAVRKPAIKTKLS